MVVGSTPAHGFTIMRMGAGLFRRPLAAFFHIDGAGGRVCAGPARAARWAFALLLAAGSATAAAQALALKYYQHSEGLTNLAVTALVMDEQERLWIGTENGLFRNDGGNVGALTLPRDGSVDRTISALALDSSSRSPDSGCSVWVGTRAALWRRCMGEWVEARDAGGAIAIDDGATLVEDGAGVLLAVSRGRMLRIEAGAPAASASTAAFAVQRIASDVPDLRFFSVLRVSAGHWWAGCGVSLCEWHGGRLDRHGVAEGVPEGRWAGLLRTSDGALWARSDAAVIRRAVGSERFEDVTPRGLSDGTVHIQLPMLEDEAGRVVIHTDDGLVRSGRDRATDWQHFGASENLDVGGGIHAMAFDPAGDLWLGTAGQGLAHWRGYRHWVSWTRKQGLPSDEAWSFLDDAHGAAWIGTGAGAALVDGREIRIFPGPPASRHQVGGMARDSSGRLWASTFSGALLRLRQDGPTPAWERMDKPGQLALVFGLVGVPGDRILVGTRRGLFEVHEAGTAKPSLQKVDLPAAIAASTVPAMCAQASDGSVWLATDKGLLLRHASGAIDKPVVEGLPEQPVEVLACAESAGLWLALSDGSLWQLRPAASGWRAEAVTSAVLGHRHIVSLLSDRSGRLWLGTDDGLLVRSAQGRWRRFDDSNGLVWSDTNGYALHEDQLGRIWVGTSRGVSCIDDASALLRPEPLQLSLDEVRQGDRRWRAAGTVTAPWSPEPIEIAWRFPGFTNRGGAIVRYRFGGASQAWLETGSSRLRFDELPAGKHHLEVFVENTDLGERSPIASLDLDIVPPWWWSRAAEAFYVAALLACLWGAVRWRVRTLLRRQAELEAQVRRRTEDLEASHEAMRALALTDALTGLMNRRAVLDCAQREMDRVRRGEGPVTLALVDIDFFKRINDTLGHLAGDDVLRQLALRLRAGTRPYDMVGRYGGEEFLVVLPGMHVEQEDAASRLRGLRENVGATPFVLDSGGELTVTCSMGAASVRSGQQVTLADLIGAADRALYRAKESGRDRVETAESA